MYGGFALGNEGVRCNTWIPISTLDTANVVNSCQSSIPSELSIFCGCFKQLSTMTILIPARQQHQSRACNDPLEQRLSHNTCQKFERRYHWLILTGCAAHVRNAPELRTTTRTLTSALYAPDHSQCDVAVPSYTFCVKCKNRPRVCSIAKLKQW
jgi:hypothetical protein